MLNSAPNCCTVTLLVVNAVSLAFQPALVLSLCWVSTDTVCGFGGRVFVVGSEQVVSSTSTNSRGSRGRRMDGSMLRMNGSIVWPDRDRPASGGGPTWCFCFASPNSLGRGT